MNSWLVVTTIAVILYIWIKRVNERPNLSILPEQFIVFDLETTGLKATDHEIIEIGAIRVNRDKSAHESFQVLIRPSKSIPKKITQITGITQDLVDNYGDSLEEAIPQFINFVGNLPLVTFNAEFDMAFLNVAIHKIKPGALRKNPVSCALEMSRRAWPELKSYRLSDLSKSMVSTGSHRALEDSKRTLTVYTAAAVKLKSSN